MVDKPTNLIAVYNPPFWPGFFVGYLPNEKERQRVNGRLHGWSVRSSQEVDVKKRHPTVTFLFGHFLG